MGSSLSPADAMKQVNACRALAYQDTTSGPRIAQHTKLFTKSPLLDHMNRRTVTNLIPYNSFQNVILNSIRLRHEPYDFSSCVRQTNTTSGHIISRMVAPAIIEAPNDSNGRHIWDVHSMFSSPGTTTSSLFAASNSGRTNKTFARQHFHSSSVGAALNSRIS